MEGNNEKMELIQKRIDELFDNGELLEQIFTAKTPDELWQLFEANGVAFEDVTKEEVFDAFQKAKNTDELSEEDLENVSGGLFWVKLVVKGITVSVGGASAGAVLLTVGGLAVIGLATYAAYRYIKKKTA